MFTIPRPFNHQIFGEIRFLENIFFLEYFFGKTFFSEFENTLKMRRLAANRTSLRQKLTEISILLRSPIWRLFWPPNCYSLDYWYEIWHKYAQLYSTTLSERITILSRKTFLKYFFKWKFCTFFIFLSNSLRVDCISNLFTDFDSTPKNWIVMKNP